MKREKQSPLDFTHHRPSSSPDVRTPSFLALVLKGAEMGTNAQQTFFALFYFLQKQKPRQPETRVPVTPKHRTLPHPGKCVAPGSEVGDTTRMECAGISLLA